VAQLFQKSPSASPGQVEQALKSTAHRYSYGAPYESGPGGLLTSYDKGTGLVDVVAAAHALP
jgi:serine protease AprX